MSATTFCTFSPLGPLHHAPPASTSSLIQSLFSKSNSDSKSKSSKSKLDAKPKRQSSETRTIPSIISHRPSSSTSSTSSLSSYCQRIPPPSYEEATNEDAGIEEDIIDSYFDIKSDDVEKRFQSWDEEIKQKKVEKMLRADTRIAEEMKRMGW